MDQETLQKVSRIANIVTAVCAVIVAFITIKAYGFISAMGKTLVDF